MLLFFLLVVPTIGIFYGFIEKNFSTSEFLSSQSLSSQSMVLIISSLPFAWSLNVLYTLFDFSTNQFQFVQESVHLYTFDFYIGLDGISLFFTILTVIIIPVAILSNWWSISENRSSFIIIMLSLETLLLLIFLVLDVLLFYIFFESILPPLFILIGLFGSYDRVRASFYLFLYTLLGSLFLLLAILSMNSIMDTTDFDTLYKSNFDYLIQLFLFYGIFIAFAVKTPTIFLNTWLLRAHVESPLGGSIILAGVVLKLSLYGIIRLILGILPKASIEYTYIIYLIAIITIFYASLSTLRTIDVKELIAYSSVSHAAVYILGVFSNVIQGIEGSIVLGLAHGFVSPGLFICAGGVLYDRSSTRLITFYKGMTQIMPLFAILFFILSLGNCGAPLTLNFIGEFLSLYGSFERLPLLGVFASSSIVFSAAYTIYMYNRISFGGVLSRFFTVNISDLNKREFNLLLTLVILTVMLGIYTVPLLDGLHYSVSAFIYLFDANSISCDGPIVWFNYFNDEFNDNSIYSDLSENSTYCLVLGFVFFMANKRFYSTRSNTGINFSDNDIENNIFAFNQLAGSDVFQYDSSIESGVDSSIESGVNSSIESGVDNSIESGVNSSIESDDDMDNINAFNELPGSDVYDDINNINAFNELPGSDVYDDVNDNMNNINAFNELSGSDVYDDINNINAFNQLPGSDVYDNVDDNLIEYNNIEEETNSIDGFSEHTGMVSSNGRSSDNDPFYYERVLADLDVLPSSAPSYRTYLSRSAPSYKTIESHVSYKSELGQGEVYFAGLEPIMDDEDILDNYSVSTQDIDEDHLLTIYSGNTTRSTYELLDHYKDHVDAEVFSEEIGNCINEINKDVNTTIQKLNKDLFKGDISKPYYRKAKELIDYDSEDHRQEVYETEQTVKERLWPDTYDSIIENIPCSWIKNGLYKTEIKNLDMFRELPFHLEEYLESVEEELNLEPISTSNTSNTSAAVSTSNTGSANDDFIENLIPGCFPITTVILYLYRFIKLHPVYSTDLELYENRVLESLKKFYFKLKNFFKNNIL